MDQLCGLGSVQCSNTPIFCFRDAVIMSSQLYPLQSQLALDNEAILLLFPLFEHGLIGVEQCLAAKHLNNPHPNPRPR